MSRRRHEDDDDRRGAKKRRVSAEPKEIEDRLESLIMRVGEKSTSPLESNLEGLAGVLEADLPSYKTKILRILCECVVKMPEKVTIYTTLIGLLNERNYNFVGEFIELLTKNLREGLRFCRFDDSRIMVRFIADLVNCYVISAGNLLNLLQNCAEVTLEIGIPQVRSDWYVYTVLCALPWVGRDLYEKKDQELDHLLRLIDVYMNKRKKIHYAGLKVWQTSPHPQEEYLDCLWAQVCKLRSDKWVEHHIVRPYLGFDGVLCEALQHDLPDITPPPHRDEFNYPFPTVIFRLFDYTDCPEGPVLPGVHSIERFLIEEQLKRIIEMHKMERKDCASQLLSFPGKTKIPLEYMIVEAVFSELLKLPVAPFLEVCYGSILLELCKLQPSTMPQVLAQAVELFYERMDSMNVDCIDRLSSWFAYHLSNFQFRWSWDDWNDCLSLDPLHPKCRFVSETLQKSLRLSYHQRVSDIMPDTFSALVPANPIPHYKYAITEGSADSGNIQPVAITAAQQLCAGINEKCTPEEALLLIKDLPNPLQEDDVEPTHNPLKIDVFVQSLLNIASKTISYAFSGIAKFHYVFKMLATSEEAQICILRSMFELWNSHQQMMCILVNKFLKTQIVECPAVANWIFSKEMSSEFTKSYIWEILHLTIKKMIGHVQKLQKELDEANGKLKKSDELDDKEQPTEELVERMEEKLEAAQSDQKNLFLIIFQRFIMILTEHIARCEVEGIDFNTWWFKSTIGRLQNIFFQYFDNVFKYVNTLESLLFTSDIDPHILSIFQQFCALRA